MLFILKCQEKIMHSSGQRHQLNPAPGPQLLPHDDDRAQDLREAGGPLQGRGDGVRASDPVAQGGGRGIRQGGVGGQNAGGIRLPEAQGMLSKNDSTTKSFG